MRTSPLPNSPASIRFGLLGALVAASLLACSDDDADSDVSPTDDAGSGADAGLDGGPDADPGPASWTLSGEARVFRDEWGIAHIYAPTAHDAFFLQGYEMARDRLWNMDFLRHFIYGTQASVYGPEFVEDDILKRGLNLKRFADENALFYAAEHPEIYRELEIFADGVNAYIADAQAGRNGATLPQEFDRIPGEYTIVPWEVRDSLAVAKALILSQSFQPDLELAFFAGSTLMGDTFREMFPFTPLFATHALEESPTPDSELSLSYAEDGVGDQKARATLTPEVGRALAELVHRLSRVAGREDVSGLGGSNAWAVADDRTASGHAMLCNDTHMGLDLPSNLYPMHIVAGGDDGFDTFGFNGPGHPYTLIGTNGAVSWGLTNAYADVTDLYRETLSADGRSVQFNGQQVPLEIRDEVIGVRQPDGTIDTSNVVTVRWVPHHGPLLNDLLPPEIGRVLTNFGFIFSVRWVGFSGRTQEFVAFNGLLRATDVQSGVEGLRAFDGGVMNLTLADDSGAIAYIPAGGYPERPWDLVATPPYVPLEGAGGFEWGPRIPYDEIPRLIDPAKGYVVNANASIGDNALDNNPETGDFYFSHFLDLGTRAWRITNLLEEAGTDVTLDELREMQADNWSSHAHILLPTLLAEQERICADAESDACEAVTLLAAWDLHQDADSVEATLFNAWVLNFMWDTYVDDTQDLVQELLGPELDNSAGRGIGHWVQGRLPPSGTNYFDNSATPDVVESAGDIAVAALDKALATLSAFYGEERALSTWRWDEAHFVTWKHQVWRDLDVGPRGMQSGFRTVNAADYRLVVEDALATPPYTMNEGPGIRFCIEMVPGAPIVTGSVNGGTSGHAESPHFIDMLDLWVAGDNDVIDIARPAIEAGAASSTTLPAGFPEVAP